MILNENTNQNEIECKTCFNNEKICPCCIYSGNSKLHNLYNIDFVKIQLNSRYGKFAAKKEDIYEAKL